MVEGALDNKGSSESQRNSPHSAVVYHFRTVVEHGIQPLTPSSELSQEATGTTLGRNHFLPYKEQQLPSYNTFEDLQNPSYIVNVKS